jgi:hypothetical protein
VVRAAGETAGSEDSALVSSQPAPPAPGGQGNAEEARGQGKGRELHSESVVKKGDGTLETRITQAGTVESVSETSITVKSEDGFTLAYAIGADTRIRKQGAAAPDGTAPRDDAGKRVKPSAATAADLKQGDTVRIRGVKNGASITARTIIEGAGGKGQGLGHGKGLGQGKGLGHGKGHGHGKGLGHGQGLGHGKAKAEDRGPADDVP